MVDKNKMKAKNFMVFFLAIASVLLIASSVSAAELSTIDSVKIDGIEAYENTTANHNPAITAGDKVVVEVLFTATQNTSDVVVEATLEGTKDSIDAETSSFTVEDGSVYKKVLVLNVPYELEDEVSKNLDLEVEIRSGGLEDSEEYTLRVQRPTYDATFMSISSSKNVEAGNIYPVEIVLKNTGYNDLDDMYVTASISGLDVERTFYLGDIVALEECNEDCDLEDTLRGTIHLEIPFDATSGEYTLEVKGKNNDLDVSDSKKIVVNNDLPKQVVVTQSEKSVSVGQEATYELTVANPTNSLKVYRVVTETSKDVSASVDSSVISIPAGTTKKVTVTAEPDTEGEFSLKVGILSGDGVVETKNLILKAENKSTDGSIVALAIALAVIFVVLLVVLIVLLGKRPKKQSEDFGESYY
ncbi:MAG TPA: hypothetical protein VJ912_03095 [Candidatus Nanoarchaeia archaeon]|nr:hypothetical protein [Candidatus Nanoarchaeia archaeon]